MNILPKKRWHVRTRENIARVRKDEAEAAEKERVEKLRTENADREARLKVLKDKSRQTLVESGVDLVETSELKTSEHINLFSDLEHAVKTTNKDHDNEVREKKEEYEKKIGYLTYLGQDTNESLKKKNWYEVLPEASRFSRSSDIKDTYEKLVIKDKEGKPKHNDLDIKDGEVSWKTKQRLDPMNAFKKYCSVTSSKSKTEKTCTTEKVTTGQMHKKHKHDKRDKNNEKQIKLQKLREARLKRERLEKQKTEEYLSSLNGTITRKAEPITVTKIKPKYNSQFNPELARQNYALH